MKHKLLRMSLLLCALIAGSSVWADEVTYDFTKIDGFDTWGTSYAQHVVGGVRRNFNKWRKKRPQFKKMNRY